MGWPVAHSRSPLIHGHWIAHYGLRGAYVPLAVQAGQLEQALQAAGHDPALIHQDTIMDATYQDCTGPWLAQASQSLAMTKQQTTKPQTNLSLMERRGR